MDLGEVAERFGGHTEADKLRVLRPGGPLDLSLYQTRCPGCGQEINRPLRWFFDQDFRCSCGGLFDGVSLQKAACASLTDFLIKTKSVPELLQIIEELGST